MNKRTKISLWMMILVVVLLLSACEKETPFTPEPYVPPPPEANIVLDGALTRAYTTYDSPMFWGYVKNTGNGTGYNCMVEITCYSDAGKTTIIDTANGFPANLGNIKPGQRAYFDAVAFNCDSHEQILSYDVTITWLSRDY